MLKNDTVLTYFIQIVKAQKEFRNFLISQECSKIELFDSSKLKCIEKLQAPPIRSRGDQEANVNVSV